MSDSLHCGAWRAETHLDRGALDCGCGWGQLCDAPRALERVCMCPDDCHHHAKYAGLSCPECASLRVAARSEA
jgi:hypothetical protein